MRREDRFMRYALTLIIGGIVSFAMLVYFLTIGALRLLGLLP